MKVGQDVDRKISFSCIPVSSQNSRLAVLKSLSLLFLLPLGNPHSGQL